MSEEKHMYDLIEERRTKPRQSNPIADAINREDEELAKEAQRLTLEAIVKKKRKEIQGIEGAEPQTVVQQGASPINQGVQLLAMLIAQGLDPEKANAYIKALDQESIMKIRASGAQDQNSLLPYLMLANREGMTVKDVVEITKTILDAAKGQGPGGSDMLTKLVTETIPTMQRELGASRDVAYQAQIAQLRQELQDNKPMDPAEYVTKISNAAKALGMKSGKESDEVAKLRLEQDRWMHEQTTKKEETQMVVGTIKDILEGKAGDVLTEVGKAAAFRLGPGGRPAGAPGQQTPPTLMVQCLHCGGTFNTAGDAKMAKCPHCGTNLEIKLPAPQAEKPRQEVQEPPRVPTPEAERGGELTPRWSGPPPEQ